MQEAFNGPAPPPPLRIHPSAVDDTAHPSGPPPPHHHSPGTDTSPDASQQAPPSRLPEHDPDAPGAIKVACRSRVASVGGKISHDVRDGLRPVLLATGFRSISNAAKAIAAARRNLRDDGVDVCFEPRFRDWDHSRALLALNTAVVPRRELALEQVAAELHAAHAAAVAAAGAVAAAAAGLSLGAPGLDVGDATGAASALASRHLPAVAAAVAAPAGGGGGGGGGANAEAPAPPYVLRVGNSSRNASVGAAIAAATQEHGVALLTALGPEALGNAVIATAHAQVYVAPRQRLRVQPEFVSFVKDGRELVGVQLLTTLLPNDGGGDGVPA